MLSTVEKVLILKTVMVFSQTPDEVLADVADLLEAVDCAGGETIIRKGDPGDSLYVIVDGRVSVRDESLELTTLGARDVFGEMALLDAEPRSATVVALEPTSLFRLAQGPFYELIDQRPEVVNGVLRVLVQRVRLLDKALEAARRPSARV